MLYDELRHFADSWGLVLLALIFVGAVLRVTLRSGKHYSDQAEIPFKHDRKAD